MDVSDLVNLKGAMAEGYPLVISFSDLLVFSCGPFFYETCMCHSDGTLSSFFVAVQDHVAQVLSDSE